MRPGHNDALALRRSGGRRAHSLLRENRIAGEDRGSAERKPPTAGRWRPMLAPGRLESRRCHAPLVCGAVALSKLTRKAGLTNAECGTAVVVPTHDPDRTFQTLAGGGGYAIQLQWRCESRRSPLSACTVGRRSRRCRSRCTARENRCPCSVFATSAGPVERLTPPARARAIDRALVFGRTDAHAIAEMSCVRTCAQRSRSTTGTNSAFVCATVMLPGPNTTVSAPSAVS